MDHKHCVFDDVRKTFKVDIENTPVTPKTLGEILESLMLNLFEQKVEKLKVESCPYRTMLT